MRGIKPWDSPPPSFMPVRKGGGRVSTRNRKKFFSAAAMAKALAAQGQIRRRLSATRKAAAILAQTGFSVRTVYFHGQYSVSASDLLPDGVVILRPVRLLEIPSLGAVGVDSSRNRKAAIGNRKSPKGGAA